MVAALRAGKTTAPGNGPTVGPPSGPVEVEALYRHVQADALVSTLAGARLDEVLHSVALRTEFSASHGNDGRIDGVLWHGGNISPIAASTAALDHFAGMVRKSTRPVGSIVGRRDQVEHLWGGVGEQWHGRAREHRWSQPLLVAGEQPATSATRSCGEGATLSGVRAARRGEESLVFPAAVAMFREEVGTDPTRYDGGASYRARVAHLIRQGRTYVITDADGVLFKADVGARFTDIAQIHGVWVRPAARGRGIATAAMRDLIDLVRADHAPVVSLYVNDFNEPARRAYASAGFTQVAELSTILF